MSHPPRRPLLADTPLPQPAQEKPVRRVVHGVELVDEYSWIRADNWQAILHDPTAVPDDIRDVLCRENDYAAAVLAPAAALRQTLKQEMRARLKEDDSQVPIPDGPFVWYTRYQQGGEHPLLCRRPRAGGAEEILLDGDKESQGKAFFDPGDAVHAPDYSALVWSADEQGSEYYTLRLRDLASGEDRDRIDNAEDGVVWSADSSAFYYVRLDEHHRPSAILKHGCGTDPASDTLVFQENDPAFFVSLDETQSGRFAVIDVHDHGSTQLWVLDRHDPAATPRLVWQRRPGVRCSLEHHGEDFFFLANHDGAVDFSISRRPAEEEDESARAVPFVAHRPGCLIIEQMMLARHHIRLERENSLPRIVIRQMVSGEESTIAFDEEAYSLWIEPGLEIDTSILRFGYSSLTTPAEIYDYDLDAGTRTLRKRQEIPGGHDPAAYVTRRLMATAPDGAQVPISLLYAKTTALDGSAPLLLQNYGAYGHATPASFRTQVFSLVDRGFVFAIAHIRGGTDCGWSWYLDGKMEKKANTFADFITVARHLCTTDYTRAGRIVAMGGSAGGLLMGAVANQAPDLFAGIIAAVPFVDVLNTILDDTLPLTPPEWHEWGNPITDPTAFARIRDYSPYDNVVPQAYPAMLVLAGLSDPRVTYWEPAKWVMRLRRLMTGGGPILLHTNMKGGHAGATGRFEHLNELAMEYAFALACTGAGP